MPPCTIQISHCNSAPFRAKMNEAVEEPNETPKDFTKNGWYLQISRETSIYIIRISNFDSCLNWVDFFLPSVRYESNLICQSGDPFLIIMMETELEDGMVPLTIRSVWILLRGNNLRPSVAGNVIKSALHGPKTKTSSPELPTKVIWFLRRSCHFGGSQWKVQT